MESVLKKTVASLETALRYNPNNIELMGSLAEGYVRMGRLDEATLSLCEKVLSKYPDNFLLEQAQTVALVVEQTDQIDGSLNKGNPVPSAEVVEVPLEMLDGFLREVPDCAVAWFAWTRLCLVAGRCEAALQGIERLLALQWQGLGGLRRMLDWVSRRQDPGRVLWSAVFRAYCAIGDKKSGIKALERVYDKGISKEEIGPILLEEYRANYTPSRPEVVPEAIRPRFLAVLLDHGDSQATEEWLRKASLYGWQLSDHSKAYARSLIEDEQLDTAFEILQRMHMDDEVKSMLNDIAAHYEKMEDIDDAVRILQYINNHELIEDPYVRDQEIELSRNTELSLAELQVKNGRFAEAFGKYVAALALANDPDPTILAKIDDLLARGVPVEPQALLRLATYFRGVRDYTRTVLYLNKLIERAQNPQEGIRELESIFDEVLEYSPDSPDLRLERGNLQRRMGRVEEAIVDYKIAAADPRLTDQANRMLALAYRETGHLREALNRYLKVHLVADDLKGLHELQAELARNDDQASAIKALELVASVDPSYENAEERLRQLRERSSRGISGQGGREGGGGGGPTDSEIKMRELIGENAIGRYKFMEKIGSGGMGVVYKVFDIRQGKAVAMKVLRDGLAASSKALERFFREARIATQIQHRNIVQIYDWSMGSQDGQNYIVMEYIDGQSIREFIDLHFDNTISTNIDYVTEMLHYTVQIFDALHQTHNKGIIHRDIKPDNIMITSDGEARVTDFGIVHVEEATFTPTGAMLGTPRYMSPEQVTGARVDGRSDIYSVGIMLYEVLTGSPPFMTGDISYQQVNKAPVEPRMINAAIPQSVNAFILKCLEKKPENRPPDAATAKVELAEILQSLGGCRKFQNSTIVGSSLPLAAAGTSLSAGSAPASSPRQSAVHELQPDPFRAAPSRGPGGSAPAQRPRPGSITAATLRRSPSFPSKPKPEPPKGDGLDLDRLELDDLDLDHR